MRTLLIACTVLLTLGLNPVCGQGGSEKPSWFPDKIESQAVPAEKVQAKNMVKEFSKAYKGAKKADDKIKLIKGLVEKVHSPDFVKPLTKILAREKSVVVKTEVCHALSVIGSHKAESALLKAIRDRKHSDELEFLIAAGRALGKSFKKSRFKALENDFQRGVPNVKRAFILAWGYSKDWNAISRLGDWVEAPSPTNVSSGTNPPASYWQARHKEWRQVQRQVEWALWAITGKVFYSNKEVRAFLKKNPKPPKDKEEKKEKKKS